jgi:HSP20 family protein
MAKSSSKQKKSEKTAAPPAPAPPSDPFRRMGLPEWFDRWPELVARNWPESLRSMPFGDIDVAHFRMEQFTDDDGTFVVRAELPGLDPDDDVEVTVDDDVLTISGEREERTEDRQDDGTYRSEFRYGTFRRSVRLPAGAETGDITATYDDGILVVRVPVDADREPTTRVPVRKRT